MLTQGRTSGGSYFDVFESVSSECRETEESNCRYRKKVTVAILLQWLAAIYVPIYHLFINQYISQCNSLWLSDALWRRLTGSSLDQVVACHLFDYRPSSIYIYLYILPKYIYNIQFKKPLSKYRLRKIRHFVWAPGCQDIKVQHSLGKLFKISQFKKISTHCVIVCEVLFFWFNVQRDTNDWSNLIKKRACSDQGSDAKEFI